MASEKASAVSRQDADQSHWDPEPSETDSPEADVQPGALRGVVTLTLETRQAQRLVKGRPGSAGKPAIIGLIGFANLLRAIWHGARADDPYADWWLIKIHQALETADQALKASIEAVEARLQVSAAIRATPGASVKPVRTPLRFSNPYAYRGAHRLADYDRLARAVLTGQYIGVMTRDDSERVLALSGRQLRRAFLSPLGYRLTGVTRQDVLQGTAKQAQAKAVMGEVPEEILTRVRRAAHAPERPMPTSSVTPHLGLHSLPSKS